MNSPVLLAGHWTTLATPLEVRSPFDGRVGGQASVGQDADFEVAAAAADEISDLKLLVINQRLERPL